MALTDENGFVTTMPVAPAYGGGNGGFGGFGGDSWGWIILLLLCAGGGWGNGFGGGYGNMMLGYDFPWLMNGQQGINNNVSDGFRDAQLNDNITSVRDGISSLSTQLCGCCGDMQMALANGFAGVEQGANARQMANMQTAFGIQSQIADSTYANGSGLADLKYTVATEACADRNAVSNGVRDIIANQTAGIQQILDKLCDQELQAERRENQNLRSELMYARGQASQVDQTAQIRASQATTANQLINELRSCPIPSQPVYGNQPIFTCPNNNSGCGCGCGNF
jgi:hypothetical protein